MVRDRSGIARAFRDAKKRGPTLTGDHPRFTYRRPSPLANGHRKYHRSWIGSFYRIDYHDPLGPLTVLARGSRRPPGASGDRGRAESALLLDGARAPAPRDPTSDGPHRARAREGAVGWTVRAPSAYLSATAAAIGEPSAALGRGASEPGHPRSSARTASTAPASVTAAPVPASWSRSPPRAARTGPS